LPDGSYLIGRCAVPTERRSFIKDGKEGVMFITTYHADGGLYEHTAFAKSAQEDTVTERGEPIRRVEIGQRVLFRRSSFLRDKASGRTMVERLNGKLLDVQNS
jgi:hypothetical protein